MNPGRLLFNGQSALTHSEELELDGHPGPAKVFENAGLLCLGLGVAGALRTVWTVAERRGRLRAVRRARLLGPDHVTAEAFAAATTRAYLQGWEDAGNEFHQYLPDRILDAMRDAECAAPTAPAEPADMPTADG